jgi:hypothetical protein
MDEFHRTLNALPKWSGVGGWKCYCCGPTRIERPLARRYARRRMKKDVYLEYRVRYNAVN